MSPVRQPLYWAAGLLVGGVLLALAIAYSGVYSIAASHGHPAWMTWFLEVAMRNSVEANSGNTKKPDLDTAALVPLGAAHFQGGCATCHGAPTQQVNPIYNHMLPSPPLLRKAAPSWKEHELYWIVKNGLQFTGMPAWSGEGRNDEVWALVAFLTALPAMSDSEYKRLANGNTELQNFSPQQIAHQGRPAGNLTACGRCHGTQTAAATSPFIPVLGGQPQEYLERALREYRSNLRQSGFMEPVAAELNDEQIIELAAFYSALNEPTAAAVALTEQEQALYQTGREIALYGDPSARVPPCQPCHDGSALNAFPLLQGQPQEYLVQQLQVWENGGRRDTPYGAMMATIAERMTPEQMKATAVFYEKKPVDVAEGESQ